MRSIGDFLPGGRIERGDKEENNFPYLEKKHILQKGGEERGNEEEGERDPFQPHPERHKMWVKFFSETKKRTIGEEVDEIVSLR